MSYVMAAIGGYVLVASALLGAVSAIVRVRHDRGIREHEIACCFLWPLAWPWMLSRTVVGRYLRRKRRREVELPEAREIRR